MKPFNITTPNVYEAAEIQKYARDIKGLEEVTKQIKAKEEIRKMEEELEEGNIPNINDIRLNASP